MRKMARPPTHPGNIIKEDYLDLLAVTIKEMAERLGVSKKTLSRIINERGAITPDMALRLSRAFGTTPDFWLNLQKNYDLRQAETTSKEWQKVKPLPRCLLRRNLSLPVENVRIGWAEAFKRMARNGDDRVLDDADTVSNAWDENEWR